MTTLEPLINLLVVLTLLSVAAERATNLLKLRSEELRNERASPEEEKERERGITIRSVGMGVVLAVIVKADIFEMLSRLEAPWETLGWVRVTAGQWQQATATGGLGTFAYALVGSAFTGIALGFGSKFWHDILDTVFELRKIVQKVKEKRGFEARAIAAELDRAPEAPHA